MGQPIPAQHPSVVLRSHFKLVRGLLALAMVAVLALTAAVVILANDDDQVSPATKAAPLSRSRRRRPPRARASTAVPRRARAVWPLSRALP